MTRRGFAGLIASALPSLRAQERVSIRGVLQPQETPEPVLLLDGGVRVALTGDEPTRGVLKDARLRGADFEAGGHYEKPGRFEIDPIHTKAIYVHKQGKKLFVTYWCDVCSIRTYTPGVCWCCQEETQLDLRESYEK